MSRSYMTAVDDAVTAILGGEAAPPGAVIGVARGGRRAFSSGGYAQTFTEAGSLATPVPMTEHVVSDLGSVTKVLATAAALMTFVARERLSLSAPVEAFVPQTRGQAAARATLEQLLRHRAGLWEWWPVYLDATGREAALDRAASLPLRYEPEAGFHYSDLGFMLLGGVVEACGGASLPSVVRSRVLDPLRLSRISFGRPVDGAVVAASSRGDAIEREMIATGRPYPVTVDASKFRRWRKRVLVGEVNDGNAFFAFGGASGHAGLFAPATELLLFGEGLLASLSGEGPIHPDVVRTFLAPGPEGGHGPGFRTWPEFGAVGHLGFPGVGVAIVPERDLAVAMVTNRLHVPGTSLRPTDEMFRTALSAALRLAGEEHGWI